MRAKDQLPPAISMVIHTEYRGQRYSMGSSDPLPAGFKIRFGSLNFQATGNGYLMRITNLVPRLRQQAASRHFARVRGVGLLRRAGPSDVPVVPRHHGLLVRLL
jgi:hypothetical protein